MRLNFICEISTDAPISEAVLWRTIFAREFSKDQVQDTFVKIRLVNKDFRKASLSPAQLSMLLEGIDRRGPKRTIPVIAAASTLGGKWPR
jgi:hypothetical protein